jgi:hypothetical protein
MEFRINQVFVVWTSLLNATRQLNAIGYLFSCILLRFNCIAVASRVLSRKWNKTAKGVIRTSVHACVPFGSVSCYNSCATIVSCDSVYDFQCKRMAFSIKPYFPVSWCRFHASCFLSAWSSFKCIISCTVTEFGYLLPLKFVATVNTKFRGSTSRRGLPTFHSH